MTKQTAQRLTRPEQQLQTREKLIDAAESLILDQSIPGLSMRAVCAQAGYSQGAFYSNFTGKDELLLAVIQRHARKERDSLKQSLTGTESGDLRQSLGAVAAWLCGLSRQREWARLSMELKLQAMRDAEFAARLQAAWSPILDEFAAVITRLTARHGLNPILPPAAVAETLAALWSTVSLSKTQSGNAWSGDDTLVAVLQSLLMPAPRGDSHGYNHQEN